MYFVSIARSSCYGGSAVILSIALHAEEGADNKSFDDLNSLQKGALNGQTSRLLVGRVTAIGEKFGKAFVSHFYHSMLFYEDKLL